MSQQLSHQEESRQPPFTWGSFHLKNPHSLEDS